MHPLQIFAISSLGISAFTGLLLFKQQKNLLNYLCLFLCFSFLFEMTNIVLARFYKGINNVPAYNIFNAVTFIFYSFLFTGIILSSKYRKAARWFMLLFALFFIYNFLFIQKSANLFTYTYITGSLMMIFSSITYFSQIFIRNDEEPISTDPFFWFCFAWLLFYSATLPMFGMFNYLNRNYPKVTSLYYNYIVLILNIVMNLLILTGFLCNRLFQKKFL